MERRARRFARICAPRRRAGCATRWSGSLPSSRFSSRPSARITRTRRRRGNDLRPNRLRRRPNLSSRNPLRSSRRPLRLLLLLLLLVLLLLLLLLLLPLRLLLPLLLPLRRQPSPPRRPSSHFHRRSRHPRGRELPS